MNQRIMNAGWMCLFIVGLVMVSAPLAQAQIIGNGNIQPVPEPASLVLFGLGSVGLGIAKRFNKK